MKFFDGLLVYLTFIILIIHIIFTAIITFLPYIIGGLIFIAAILYFEDITETEKMKNELKKEATYNKTRDTLNEFKDECLKNIFNEANITDESLAKLQYWSLPYKHIEDMASSALLFFNYPTNKFGYYEYESQSFGTILLNDINSIEVKKEYGYLENNTSLTKAIITSIIAKFTTIENKVLTRVYIKIHINNIKHSTFIIDFHDENQAEEFEGIIIALKNKYGNI